MDIVTYALAKGAIKSTGLQGNKATVAEIQAITDANIGDIWKADEDGNWYKYDGSQWNVFGGGDMEGKLTYKGEIEKKLDLPHIVGDTYKVKSDGAIAGKQAHTGDFIVCIKDGTVEDDNDWAILSGIDGIVASIPLASNTAKGAIKYGQGTFTIAINGFTADATYADYPFRKAVEITGCTSDHFADVCFDLATATGGKIAPVVETYDGGFYVYASEQNAEQIIGTYKVTYNGDTPIVDEHNYLCFTGNPSAETNGVSTIAMAIIGNLTTIPTLEYSTDKKNWTAFVMDYTEITLNEGDKVYFRGDNNTFSMSSEDYVQFAMTGSISASGNIMSLVDSTCESLAIPNDYCFSNLFDSGTALTTAPELPATELTEGCYNAMFYGCESLVTAPQLPATTLANSCYICMFGECSSLEEAPELPATELAESCYDSMFIDCTNLVHIKIHFTEWEPSNATDNWVYGIGTIGLFECPSSLSDLRGESNIPYNWAVEGF